MTSDIHSWIDGYLAVRDRAYEVRGFVEINPDTPDAARWPRTTGADVVTIAAILDATIRKHGSSGIVTRWRDALADLQRDGLGAPNDSYPHDRSFWSTFEAVAVYLDDVEATPLVPAIWRALIAQVSRHRNAGPREDGPFAHFENIKTFDDLYNAQRAYLIEKRGADTVEPPAGFGGGPQPVPRTTNADVLQLATYWTQQLSDTKHEMGHDGVVKVWQAALDDVDKIAKPGKPDEVYPHNNEFWASCRRVAMQVAVSDEAPSKWSMVVSSVKDSILAVPKTIEQVAEKGASIVGNVAGAVGNAAGEVGGAVAKGFLEALKTPLLVGAGLLGVYLISRNNHHEAA